MAPVLKVFFEFLRRVGFARDYIKRFPRCAASLLSFLGLKLDAWWRFWIGKLGSFGQPDPAERPSLGTEASSYPAPGGSAVVKKYVVAASSVSASASHPSPHERTQRQPATAAQTVGVHAPILASFSVDHSHSPNPAHPLGGRSPVNRTSRILGAVSIQSRASDRFSIITNSRESMRAPLGQPSRLPRLTHGQFGVSPDPSRSREQPTGPPARPYPPHPPHLETITTNLPSPSHGDGKVSSVVQPSSSSSHTHQLLSPPPMNEIRTRQSSTSADVDVQESLSISSPTYLSQMTFEPFDSATVRSPMSSNPTILDHFMPEGRFVMLIDSEQIPRYTKDIKIPRRETIFHLKPLAITFPYFPEPSSSEQDLPQQDCSPWKSATHPDGALYFYDEGRGLFTDTDMHDSTMRDEIEEFYNCLQRVIYIDQLSIPSKSNYDLVLNIMVTDDKRISWSYYYACHEARCLFWLETYDMIFSSRTLGVNSPAHIKHRLEELYWNHWSLYPANFSGRDLPLNVYDELMGTLTHGCIDMTTSKLSALPYNDDTMHRWIQLVQKAKDTKGGSACYTAGITRLLSFFACWRFLDFHGQPHARLVKGQTVYDKPRHERSLLITILSPLLFLAPEGQLREMDEWIDGSIIEPEWKSFIVQTLAEWEGVILWSTVMLSANVGFLAIPGVVLSNLNDNLTSASQVVIFTSYSQIASSLSMEASIGSIIIGLLLVRVNRTIHNGDPTVALTYLNRGSHGVFGLELMAIYFSLPWALLMWSMVMFSIALLLLCFTISNDSTRIFVAIMSALVATLIGWCIRTSWDLNEDGEVWQKSLAVLRRTCDVLFGRVKGFNPFHTRRIPQDDHITLTGRLRRTAGVVFGRVQGFNPFHTRRAPQDNHIDLTRLDEVGVL